VSQHFSSINPLTIDALTLDWWCVYVAHTQRIVKREAEIRAQLARR